MTTGIGALSVKCRGGATTDFATLFGRDTAPGGVAFAHRRRTTRWNRGGDALHRRALSLWAAGSCEVRISYDSRQHGGVGRDERIATLRYPVTAGACEINDMDVRSPHAVGWVVVDRHDGQTKFLYAHLLREVDAV
jgi:hypothetical protein